MNRNNNFNEKAKTNGKELDNPQLAQNFFKSILKFCEECQEEKETIIIIVSQRGKTFFDYLMEKVPEYESELSSRNIQVTSKEELDNECNYPSVINKNIILFNDMFDNTFEVFRAHLTRRLQIFFFHNRSDDTPAWMLWGDFKYNCYAFIKCDEIRYINPKIYDKTKTYLNDRTVKEYVNFFIEENKLFSRYENVDILLKNSGPIAECEVKDLEIIDRSFGRPKICEYNSLKNKSLWLNPNTTQVARGMYGWFYENSHGDTIERVAKKRKWFKDDNGILGYIISNEKVKKIASSSIITTICEVKYFKNKSTGNYRVVFLPYVLFQSFYGTTLVELYNQIFDNTIKAEKNSEMQYYSSMMMNKINNFFEAIVLKDLIQVREAEFKIKGIEMRIINIPEDIQNVLKDEDKINRIRITRIYKNEDRIQVENINWENILYNMVVRGKYEKRNDIFTTMEEIYKIRYNILEHAQFPASIIEYLDKQLWEKQASFFLLRSRVDVVFVPSIISKLFLPVPQDIYDTLFSIIYRYYQKVNGNYELFMKNYDLFINKVYVYLRNEESARYYFYQHTRYILGYYKNIKKEEFKFIFEGGWNLVQDGYHYYNYSNLWIVMMLESSDFSFNGGTGLLPDKK